MNKPVDPQLFAYAASYEDWQRDYAATIATDKAVTNRSGVAIKPLYTALDWNASERAAGLGMPGQAPYTRGIYATMHRGRTWTQRQLIGLGTPADYNQRLLGVIAQGANAVSLIPCTSVFRVIEVTPKTSEQDLNGFFSAPEQASATNGNAS